MGKQHTPGHSRLGKYIVGIEDDADAALILAAPDMLEALRNAENVLAEIIVGRLHIVGQFDSQALAKIRAAIAKAEGKA